MDLLNNWIQKIRTNDPNQVTQLYHEDGLLLGTFSDLERNGHDLILEYFQHLLENEVNVKIITEHKKEYDSLIVSSGLYNFILKNKVIKARFSFVFKRLDEGWKILSHHSSVLPE